MSRFCPSYTAYSVTVSWRIAFFQQLAYCIGADSVDSADSAISVTPFFHGIFTEGFLPKIIKPKTKCLQVRQSDFVYGWLEVRRHRDSSSTAYVAEWIRWASLYSNGPGFESICGHIFDIQFFSCFPLSTAIVYTYFTANVRIPVTKYDWSCLRYLCLCYDKCRSWVG